MEVDVVEVSSVSRQTRPLAETAAAAFVISGEDVRRSGATNIPEALRSRGRPGPRARVEGKS